MCSPLRSILRGIPLCSLRSGMQSTARNAAMSVLNVWAGRTSNYFCDALTGIAFGRGFGPCRMFRGKGGSTSTSGQGSPAFERWRVYSTHETYSWRHGCTHDNPKRILGRPARGRPTSNKGNRRQAGFPERLRRRRKALDSGMVHAEVPYRFSVGPFATCDFNLVCFY